MKVILKRRATAISRVVTQLRRNPVFGRAHFVAQLSNPCHVLRGKFRGFPICILQADKITVNACKCNDFNGFQGKPSSADVTSQLQFET